MELTVALKERSYPVYIQPGILHDLRSYLPKRNYVLLTDSNIPAKWVDLVAEQIEPKAILTIPAGEASKSFDVLEEVLYAMADLNLTRKDALVALGGGVVGDLGGFAAATYMRGIDFYNIPTSSLAQIDSSVGGKTAIDLGLYKNLVGAFWQPKAVFIDSQTLSTLDERNWINGLVEAIKMGLILDEGILEEFEKESPDYDAIIARSIELKAMVVTEDEKEQNLRKVLNFGHTIGHALEAAHELAYLHGESVAAGILMMITDPALKERVQKIYKKIGVPSVPLLKAEEIAPYLVHDKKGQGQGCSVVLVDQAGSYRFETISWDALLALYERGLYAQ